MLCLNSTLGSSQIDQSNSKSCISQIRILHRIHDLLLVSKTLLARNLGGRFAWGPSRTCKEILTESTTGRLRNRLLINLSVLWRSEGQFRYHFTCLAFEVSFVVCQSFNFSRIAKSQRLEHPISFFHDWSCSFLDNVNAIILLMCADSHALGRGSRVNHLCCNHVGWRHQSFAKKRFWKKAVLIYKLTGSSRFSSTDRSMH